MKGTPVLPDGLGSTRRDAESWRGVMSWYAPLIPLPVPSPPSRPVSHSRFLIHDVRRLAFCLCGHPDPRRIGSVLIGCHPLLLFQTTIVLVFIQCNLGWLGLLSLYLLGSPPPRYVLMYVLFCVIYNLGSPPPRNPLRLSLIVAVRFASVACLVSP